MKCFRFQLKREDLLAPYEDLGIGDLRKPFRICYKESGTRIETHAHDQVTECLQKIRQIQR